MGRAERSSLHSGSRLAALCRPICGGAVRLGASSDVRRQLAGRAVRAECLARSEDSLLSFFTVRCQRAYRRFKYGKRHWDTPILWSIVWIAISIFILVVALRQYVASRSRSFGTSPDLSLDRTADMWSMPALPSASDHVRADKSV